MSAQPSSDFQSASSALNQATTVIVLFRYTDLRVHDHAPLAAAHGFTQSYFASHPKAIIPPAFAFNSPAVGISSLPTSHHSYVLPLFIFDTDRWFSRLTLLSILDGPTETTKKENERQRAQQDSLQAEPEPVMVDLNRPSHSSLSNPSSLFGIQIAKMDVKRAVFLSECVSDLRATLRKLGSDLVVRTGRTEDVLTDIVSQLSKASQPNKVVAIYAHEEYAEEELQVERKCKQALQINETSSSSGIRWINWHGNTLFEPCDLPWEISKIPDVYTPFRQKVENEHVPIRATAPFSVANASPQQSGSSVNALRFTDFKPLPPAISPGELPSLEQLGYHPDEIEPIRHSRFHAHTSFPLRGGETVALKHLQNYLWTSKQVNTYKETRNNFNGVTYSSKLSPFLSQGCLSPRRIYEELKAYESAVMKNESTYWLFVELLFRDHFRFLAQKYGRSIFFAYGPNRSNWARLESEDAVSKWGTDLTFYRAWTHGKTGYPLVDSCMRELKETGFMSNRGRQIVASFLIHDMKLDWRLGAAWFESLLLDHDVASNYGNWAYQAGVGFDPRSPYRYFNLHTQQAKYDPSGSHSKLWIPELKGQTKEIADRKQKSIQGFFKPVPAKKGNAISGDSKENASEHKKNSSRDDAATIPYPRPIVVLQSDLNHHHNASSSSRPTTTSRQNNYQRHKQSNSKSNEGSPMRKRDFSSMQHAGSSKSSQNSGASAASGSCDAQRQLPFASK